MIVGDDIHLAGLVIPLAPVVAVVGVLSLAGFLAAIWGELSRNRVAQRRRVAVLGKGAVAAADPRGKDRNRRKDIESTLKEIEENSRRWRSGKTGSRWPCGFGNPVWAGTGPHIS